MKRLSEMRSPGQRAETPAERAAGHVQAARRMLRDLTPADQAYVAELARELLREVADHQWSAFAAELDAPR